MLMQRGARSASIICAGISHLRSGTAGTKTLFCARDHFGIKPFYYADLDDQFLFSSVLDCVRLHPDVSDTLNETAIGDFLLFGLNYDGATTAFRDVRRLLPAHSLTIKKDEFFLKRYWSPPTQGRIRYRDANDYIEQFKILLQAAVKDRVRTDRVGVLLSGGLDSAAVATTARAVSKGRRRKSRFAGLYARIRIIDSRSRWGTCEGNCGILEYPGALSRSGPFAAVRRLGSR